VLAGPSPINRVTKMLDGMLAKIDGQGKMEQASYDKFADWGEKTVAGAAADIEQAKKDIDELQNGIVKLTGSLGSLEVSIKQLNTDIASNREATKDATAVRDKERNNFEDEKTESEQCIGALSSSIKVIGGKGKFLQNGDHAYQTAELMSVVADVRGVLRRPVTHQLMSEHDMQTVREFVSNAHGGANSMMQTSESQNPFGDYAPQSDQIQGILKGLHDQFIASLAKAKTDESNTVKNFKDLMETKKQELKTLTTSLDAQEKDSAEKTKSLADSKEQLDDTKADLKTAKSLFEETKKTCETKAKEWEARSSLRKMEMQGIAKALAILKSPKAQKAFKGAAASLVQVSQSQHGKVRRLHSRAGVAAALRKRAYGQLHSLAATYQNMATAKIAVQLKSGDAFGKVIMMIDMMITKLRKEEQEDIEHRDRCQNSENANGNEKEDLEHSATTMKAEIARMKEAHKAKQTQYDLDETAAQEIQDDLDARLKLRNEEHEEFKRALESDTDAVKIIGMAQKALSDFFEKQKSFAQIDTDADPKKAPKVETGKYGGDKSMNNNAMTALDVIKEDLEKEIKTGKSEDDENQKQYESDAAAMEEALATKKDSLTAIKKQLAEGAVKLDDKEAAVTQNGKDADEAKDMEKALETDCAWVKTNFDKRRSARKAEIVGLEEAKDHLAKGQDDEDDFDMDSF